MKPEMRLTDKIERVFSTRTKPAQVRLADDVLQLDFEVEEALWFSGRDWHEVTWQDWQDHDSAIFFFDSEAFAYYLPSVLLLSAQQPKEELAAANSLISQLDCSPDPKGWPEGFASRFLELNQSELGVLREWLLHVCQYTVYRRFGLAGSGPGDTFGRAFDTVNLLEKEVERRRGGSA